MGSVSRFLSALGGLFLFLLAVGLFGIPIVQTLADPNDADFPGGSFGIVMMLALMGSVPATGAVMLLRRAFRGVPGDANQTTGSLPSAGPAATPAQEFTERHLEGTQETGGPPELEPSPSIGLEQPPSSDSASDAVASPGKPSHSTRRVRQLLTNLFGTSFGRGVLTTIIGVPVTIASGDAAPLAGPYAMTIFSLVDPLPMAVQPRWWRNAFISGTVCFVLYLIFAMTVQIVSGQTDQMIGFILPFMAYPLAMGLSGIIRFFQWMST